MKITTNHLEAASRRYAPAALGNGDLSILLDYEGIQRQTESGYGKLLAGIRRAGFRYDTQRGELISFGYLLHEMAGLGKPVEWEQSLDHSDGVVTSNCRYSDGTVIEWPGVPSSDALASGTIDLQAGVTIDPETEFPNYQASKELGSWEIVPRTVTVSWRWYGGSWHASLGNILEGDDVAPAMENGILTLVGEKAGCYQVAEADQTPPAPPSPASL